MVLVHPALEPVHQRPPLDERRADPCQDAGHRQKSWLENGKFYPHATSKDPRPTTPLPRLAIVFESPKIMMDDFESLVMDGDYKHDCRSFFSTSRQVTSVVALLPRGDRDPSSFLFGKRFHGRS